MTRDARHDILFEPAEIGPKTARNRFYQVPHCNGMGHSHPAALAEMRAVKAEGGWAVVCTEEVEIHHTSCLDAAIEGRLWDEGDIPYHARTVQRIQQHGALAGIELVHSGRNAPNGYSRVAAMAPSIGPTSCSVSGQARAMTLGDIADVRRWHRDAVQRALRAGYDLVYVYAGHGLTLIQDFLSPARNDRTDAYGGSLANRARLLREILTDTLELCDGTTAVAVRLAVDELIGPQGWQRQDALALFDLLGELPDLWDLMVGDWQNDSGTARFSHEGAHEDHLRGFKELTSKPVVVVGRYTSPDAMARLISSGTADFVGAARPSIADPFLPNKIEQGRYDEIRECIGCNICVSSDWLSVPIRCTQNSAMGEEWRRGWHPERIAPASATASTEQRRILVIGGGPAGLEATLWLARRGYRVLLAERESELGGRVNAESRLPGLGAWGRVRDHRTTQLAKLPNVTIALGSPIGPDDVDAAVEDGFTDVVLATGSTWDAHGRGRYHRAPVFTTAWTPDDVLAGRRPAAGQRVLVYDDDNDYLGALIAELLAREGFAVTLATPQPLVSAWTVNTMEQPRIHRRLHQVGVEILVNTAVTADPAQGRATLVDVRTDESLGTAADLLISLGLRRPNSGLLDVLQGRPAAERLQEVSVTAIGDCFNPARIVDATAHGRRYAEEFGAPSSADPDRTPFAREWIALVQ